ncbi:MAG TPA: class I SAM-dependent methyltransferase [Nitrosopumilaceae archaeon]|nr:class I SAM-dependent methyltransferase [Nitrosopumilaceae archaeon]
MPKFDPESYKKRIVNIWNEVALKYHTDWASKNTGPFKSTSILVKTSKIKKGDRVLDLACGTGAVTKKISSRIGPSGKVVGIDISSGPVKIAKKWNVRKNVKFVIADVEKMRFSEEFDSVTCQYGLMFFPNVQIALRNTRRVLKNGGRITVAVHGSKKTAPYFSCISNAILKFIPDFIPPGSPTVHRFGTKNLLKKEFVNAGFKKIKIHELNFEYKPGTFEDYWSDYITNLSTPLKEKLKSLDANQFIIMKKMMKKNTERFTKKGKIVFPWKVLILTAINPKKVN